MKAMVHVQTGERALVREMRPYDPKRVLVQMSRFDHEHSHGWYRYPRAEFKMPDTVRITHDVKIVTRSAFQAGAVGCAMRHPDGRLVYITGGQFLSSGRISNFWTWRPIDEDGNLGPEESGYGW